MDHDGELTTTTLSGLNFDMGCLDSNKKTNNAYTQMKEQLGIITFLIEDKCIRTSNTYRDSRSHFIPKSAQNELICQP